MRTRLTLAFLIALASPAQQPPAAPGKDDKPDIAPVVAAITVIGTRSPMEIDRSPVSTSLITRQEIEQRNVKQVDQALTLIEGVNTTRSRGYGDGSVGVGLRGFSGRGSQGRTLILVDGQPVNDSYNGSVSWSAFAVSEMERVEVARGPFSSLYGGNAMGGVINLITRPVDKRQFEIFGQYGNREISNYSLRYAERLFGELGLSAGYSRLQNGGYATQEVLRAPANLTGGSPVTGARRWMTTAGTTTFQVGEQGRNWTHQEAFRGRAEYTFSPKLFASAQYIRQSREAGFDAYTSFLRDGAGNVVDRGTILIDDGGVTRRFALTPANFIGLPTGNGNSIYQGQLLATVSAAWNVRVAGGFNDTPLNWYVTPGATATLQAGTGAYNNTFNKAVYGNAQLTRQSGGQSLVFGTETRHDRARTGAQPVPNYALRANQGNYDTQARGRSLNQAAYAQYQRVFFEKLNVVGGARWDYWRTYGGMTQFGTGQPARDFANRTANAVTGKLAAAYSLAGGWQLRGSAGNAFRNPSVFDLYRDVVDAGILLLANPFIKPERMAAYEAGVTRNFSGRWSASATAFQNGISDLIYRVTDFAAAPNGTLRRLSNAGLGRIRGAEASTQQQVTRWLQFRQSYTYTNSIITRNDALPATVGKRVPWVPRHTVAYMVTAVRPKWSATWTGRYLSRQYSTDTNTDVVRGVPGGYDPFFETDATFSYDVHRTLALIVNADNLFGRRFHLFYLTPGRTVLAGFRWRM